LAFVDSAGFLIPKLIVLRQLSSKKMIVQENLDVSGLKSIANHKI
jgi:hypothetical protein